MRGLVILGTALIVIAGTVFLRGLSAPKREVGDVTLTEEGRPIAPWVTGLAVLAGVALVTAGKRRRA